MKVLAIIQARMASSRLPGKIMKEINGTPMLQWVVERAMMAEMIDDVVVASTTDASDDPVEQYCREQGWNIYRGSMYDVLDRFYQAALAFEGDLLVRITADCPLIDPGMLDDNLRSFLEADPPLDFAANRLPPPFTRTVPIGLDAEYCTMAGLKQVWQAAHEKRHREHVMPYFYEHPEIFKIEHFTHEPDYGHLRWTVDTPADLEMLNKLVPLLPDQEHFTWLEVLEVFQAHPGLSAINAEVIHKDYRELDARG